MRLFFWLLKLALFLSFLFLLGLPVYLLVSAVQPLPLVEAVDGVEQRDVARARELFEQHDPRGLEDGEVRPVAVQERDLRLMLASLLPPAGSHRLSVDLDSGSMDFYYSLLLPQNPLGKYFNLAVHARQRGDEVELDRVAFGSASLPGWALRPVVAAANASLKNRFDAYARAVAALRQVEFREDSLYVVYQWDAGLAEELKQQAREYMLPEADRARILAYYGEISRQSRLLSNTGSLTALLQPLFQLAQERASQSGDPGAENRALFIALGLAYRGESPEGVLGSEAGPIPEPPRKLRYKLLQRTDLANHFILSAGVAAVGGGALADAVGVLKELDDSQGGSGFSFADLLADRAGVRLVEAAVGARAEEIQRIMAGKPGEATFMPAVSQLPDGLQRMEFEGRFKNLDSESYARLVAEIDRRIAACPLYR